MIEENKAVLILSHGRADNLVTIPTLRKAGYTGRIFIVVDDTDSQIGLYRENFGSENVIVFDKEKAWQGTDTVDNFHKMKAVVYARNKTFDIASELGLTHFCVLDDDYDQFCWRTVDNEKGLTYTQTIHLDDIFNAYWEFLDCTEFKSISMYQNGDLIGGKGNTIIADNLVKRKVMNVFFCRTDRPFRFYGSINEDVNCYVLNGSRGELFCSAGNIFVNQATTQQNKGGLTDIYLDLGTYVKSFYSVICLPSAVKISYIGGGGAGVAHYRIHHRISWNNCVPQIVPQSLKKLA